MEQANPNRHRTDALSITRLASSAGPDDGGWLLCRVGRCGPSWHSPRDLHGILQGNCYLNPLGPLSDEWRAGDSTWTLASAAELAEACERVEQMDGEGTMEGFLAECERRRKLVG